ncbi:hypothetical protein BJI47_04460 [Rhodococcus sp. 1168]|nr:hypothetical protein BJI47_04460 [Rhodococcus sp. 1168]
MTNSDFRRFGELMTQSHASMRDDFEITTVNIDLIGESTVRHGALGVYSMQFEDRERSAQSSNCIRKLGRNITTTCSHTVNFLHWGR